MNRKNSSLRILSLSLALIYIWFGLLKVFTISPVSDLIQTCFPFFPEPFFLHVLGIGEVLIGLGLLFKKTRKIAALLLFLHMLGIFAGLFLKPSVYFSGGNIFLLTTYGEFVVKNIILIAAAVVIYKES